MHVSLSEIESTVCKAAWGVGLALGLGEDAGRAARRLVVQGLTPLGAYAEALQRIEAGRSDSFDPARAASGDFVALSPGRDLSALHAGPAARDLLVACNGPDASPGKAIVLTRVDLPLLVLAELLGASEDHRPGFAFTNDGSIAGACTQGGITFAAGNLDQLMEMGPCDLTLLAESGASPSRESASKEDSQSATGFEVEREVWRPLAGFAARCLVEASETSRLQGAGAGLVDRD